MTAELAPQRLQLKPAKPPEPTAVELNEIQGDILIGLQKQVERFVFIQIADSKTFKKALPQLAGRITTSQTVYEREFALHRQKPRGHAPVLPNVGLNVGFTNNGLQKLKPGADLKDPSFASGAEAQAAALGDPMNGAEPAKWLPEFRSGKIDGILLITGGSEAAVKGELTQIRKILEASVSVIYDETGEARSGAERGHEHFGWRDGISQPGIKGLSDPFPGQRLLDPGHFVFGYPGHVATPPLPWMKNGSFMVFRRLKQLVPEFNQFLVDEAASLGMDPVLLGARLVGRWQSGAPVDLTPAVDDPVLGGDPQRNNNFDFANDPAEHRCPFGAHIRKTNPREDFAPAGGQADKVDPHRIIRAGIPFGPEVSAAEKAAHQTKTERGLMFVCYQTSIANQFEFVQMQWANNPGFISGKKHPDGTNVTVGWDPIIGQNSTDSRLRTMDEPVSNYPTGNRRSTLREPKDFVVPTGGAYFFMPSIAAMKTDLSA